MGTHSTLPSSIVPPQDAPRPPAPSDGSPAKYIGLASYLQRHPALVGARSAAPAASHGAANGASPGAPDGTLPFLFKILSIGKALSIQAHPDKELAKRLHAEKPKMYKDDNHKPEMTIALTPFRGFCGFRPLSQIADFLDKVPELRTVVNASDVFTSTLTYAAKPSSRTAEDEVKRLLKEVFSMLMKAQPTEVKRNVMGIAQRYRKALDDGSETVAEGLEVERDVAELVCTLNEQFPGDVGVLCAFVLNVVTLKPGEAMFLKANDPHAYISGDIVECMAASDNVVRAGLTPKARDVQVLVDMLTYDTDASNEKRMAPQPFASDAGGASSSSSTPTVVYDPPIDEFAVLMTTLDKGASETQRALRGPSILITTQGTGTLRTHPVGADAASSSDGVSKARTFALDKPGQVFFVGAGTRITLESSATDKFVVYRAFYEAAA